MTTQEKWNIINRKLSAAFLLANVAYTCIDDAEDVAQDFGGFKFAFKMNIGKAKKGLEEYMSIIRREASSQGKAVDFFDDYEHLEKIVQDFIKLKEWK